jgi:hypothetical protein
MWAATDCSIRFAFGTQFPHRAVRALNFAFDDPAMEQMKKSLRAAPKRKRCGSDPKQECSSR